MKVDFVKCIRSLFRPVEKFREYRTEVAHRQQVDMVVRRFNLKEVNGEIFLMCQGVPYKRVAPGTTAKEILSMLDDARLSALEYERLQNSPSYQLEESLA